MGITNSSLGQDNDEGLQVYIGKIIRLAENNVKDLNPALEEFQALVEGDDTLRTLSSQMFEEVPMKAPYNLDSTGRKSQVRNFNHMLQLANYIVRRAPDWDADANDAMYEGSPLVAILDWPLGTISGGAFFLRHDVNQQWTKILNVWAEYLGSELSASVLDDCRGGWFGKDGMDALTTRGNVGKTHYTFDQLYVCDSTAPHYGFTSWDDFFVRRFKPGVRPIAIPEGGPPDPNFPDPTVVIVTSCEAVPVRLERNVQARDAFWLKGQPYSILDMLANDELAPEFGGGTVYQAYLCALSYHRWHSPVSGTVVKTYIVPGAIFAENYFQGSADLDPTVPKYSQAYLAEVATRALVFIQADNLSIGLMCIVFIGMGEVSSCDIAVKPGQHVTKGDDIGMFHYGGSTYCLVFRKDVDLLFEPFEADAKHDTPVRSKLAVVRPQVQRCIDKGEI